MASNALNLEVCDLERRFGIVSKTPAKCDKHGEYAAVFRRNSDKPTGCPECSRRLRLKNFAMSRPKCGAGTSASVWSVGSLE